MIYVPTDDDNLERSLWSFEEHVKELEGKTAQMTPDQRRAFIMICARIAGMEEKAAA